MIIGFCYFCETTSVQKRGILCWISHFINNQYFECCNAKIGMWHIYPKLLLHITFKSRERGKHGAEGGASSVAQVQIHI